MNSFIDNINASNISGTINANISSTGDMDDIDLEDQKNNTIYSDDDESVYSYTNDNQGWSDEAVNQLLIFLSKSFILKLSLPPQLNIFIS